MPSDNRQQREPIDESSRMRTIRFEITPDTHQPLSDDAQATLRRLSEEAASRAEYQYFQQYQNSWGDWDSFEESISRREREQERREAAAVPEDRNARFAAAYGGTVTGRMSSSEPNVARPSARITPRQPTFDRQHAFQTLEEQGYSDWTFVLEVPPPYHNAAVTGVIECTRINPSGETETRYFVFINSGVANRLMLNWVFSESEYVSLLRRHTGDVRNFYKAQAEGRRRMIAKVLAGGSNEYQLLLPAIVDDDTLRNSLTSREYRRYLATHENRVNAAKSRMREFKRNRSQLRVSDVSPTPTTSRGQRAYSAHRRNNGRRNPFTRQESF